MSKIIVLDYNKGVIHCYNASNDIKGILDGEFIQNELIEELLYEKGHKTTDISYMIVEDIQIFTDKDVEIKLIELHKQ